MTDVMGEQLPLPMDSDGLPGVATVRFFICKVLEQRAADGDSLGVDEPEGLTDDELTERICRRFRSVKKPAVARYRAQLVEAGKVERDGQGSGPWRWRLAR